jgi:hypothetical protein
LDIHINYSDHSFNAASRVSNKRHELMTDLYGYETAPQKKTFDTYNDVDCIHYSGLHDCIKLIKHGYGKVTDHASREIRLKRMTREEGIEMVEKYQHKKPSDLPEFLKWIEMDEQDLWNAVEAHRNTGVWQKYETGQWELKDPVTNHIENPGVDKVRLEKVEDCEFVVTPSKAPRGGRG